MYPLYKLGLSSFRISQRCNPSPFCVSAASQHIYVEEIESDDDLRTEDLGYGEANRHDLCQ